MSKHADLIALLRSADKPSRELDARIWCLVNNFEFISSHSLDYGFVISVKVSDQTTERCIDTKGTCLEYTASLDAITRLISETFRTYSLQLTDDPSGCGVHLIWWPNGLADHANTIVADSDCGGGNTIELAACIALVTALEARSAANDGTPENERDNANAAHIVHCVNTNDQSQARIRELEAALHNLENACDLMASTRSQLVYDTMVAEQETELFALDKARLSARDALKSTPAPVNGGDAAYALDAGDWFYPEGDTDVESCCFSTDKVVERIWDGSYCELPAVVTIQRALLLPDVYAAVIPTEERFKFTLHATEVEAEAALSK